MGVEGLWKLLEPTKKTVTLESLNGKTLAVDLSLWIHQAIRGCAGRQNEKNAHLKVLYFRICKLLFYGVRPIFVFDGPNVPYFKQLTLAKRRMKRVESVQKLTKIQKKLLKKLAETLATGENGPTGENISAKNASDALEMADFADFSDQEDSFPSDFSTYEKDSAASSLLDNSFDLDDPDFRNLPFDVQSDILLNMRENARFSSKITHLPEDSGQFSSFQMKNLLHKSKINQKLDQLRYQSLLAQFNMSGSAGDKDTDNIMTKVRQLYHGNQRTHLLYELDRPDDNDKDAKESEEILSPNVEERFIDKDLLSSDKELSKNDFDESNESKNLSDTMTKMNNFIDNELSADDIEIFADKELSTVHNKITDKEISNDFFDRGEIDQTSQPISQSIDLIRVDNVKNEPSQNVASIGENKIDVILASDKEIMKNNYKANSSSDDDDDFVEVQDSAPNFSLSRTDNHFSAYQQLSLPSIIIDDNDEPCCSKTIQSKNQASNICGGNVLLSHDQTISSDKKTEIRDFDRLDGDKKKIMINDNKDDVNSDNDKILESLEQLRERKRKFEAVDRTMTSEIIDECETLIKLFGLPCVRSAGEAEAQCAHLEGRKVTSGTVTDDSDVWLFGGHVVYRHVFDKKHYVEKYDSQSIQKNLGLTRHHLIKLAMLIGCDYTEGLNGIGVVTGLEILAEFSKFETLDDILGSLKEFRLFYEKSSKLNNNCADISDKRPGNSIRSRILNLNISFPPAFPDRAIFDAFERPNVDDHVTAERVEFLAPKIDELKRFAASQLGWSLEKIQQTLNPAMDRYQSYLKSCTSNRQLSIKNFTFSLHSGNDDSTVDKVLDSKKRMTKALEKLKNSKKPTDNMQIGPNGEKSVEKLKVRRKNLQEKGAKSSNLTSNVRKQPRRACTHRNRVN